MNQRLREVGIPEEAIALVQPHRHPILAVTPEEIAVSIAGEMIQVRAAPGATQRLPHARDPDYGSF